MESLLRYVWLYTMHTIAVSYQFEIYGCYSTSSR